MTGPLALPQPVALVADPLSSSSLRVLCALRIKGVALPLQTVRLRAGEQHGAAHQQRNPAGAVPVLLLDNGEAIAQSLAILEYLELIYRSPRLLPAEPLAAARVRSVCLLMAADVHPLTNLRVRAHVASVHGAQAGQDWVHHWSQQGLLALEGWLARWAGRYAVGDDLSLADCVVAPAVFTMHRLGCPPVQGSRVARLYAELCALPAFAPLVL